MKKILFAVPLAALLVPFVVSAHQHAEYEIGGQHYSFTVGSLNEPIAVDDKTGVDLRVVLSGHEHMEENDHHAAGGGVTGLEQTLQVELISGEHRKVLDLTPAYNEPGSYYASFFPTTEAPLSYRFFGTIGGQEVDLTFACRPEGETATEEGEKEVSEGVTQISKTGGFGCPDAKEVLGFPEASATVHEVQSRANSAKAWSYAGFALAAVALGLSLRRRN